MGGLAQAHPHHLLDHDDGRLRHLRHPPLAGFFSKDEILYRTFTSDNPIGKLLWLVGLVTAGMTSFYMFRLWFKTFLGPEHFEEQPTSTITEPPSTLNPARTPSWSLIPKRTSCTTASTNPRSVMLVPARDPRASLVHRWMGWRSRSHVGPR